MKKEIIVEHISIEIGSNFEHFTFGLEKALGILTPSALHALGAVPGSMAPYLMNTHEENSLVLFNILSNDDLYGKDSNGKIRQYQVGNPGIICRITAKHAAAGLYFPITLLVYEKSDGKVIVEYDRPSSIFKQFDNEEILSDSLTLENNLVKLISTADKENPEH
jgi:hypothetical protein